MRYIHTFILFTVFAARAIAQETNELATQPGKWVYKNELQSNEWYAERFYKMNAGELLQYHNTTEKIAAYLHQQPIAQHPSGVTLDVKVRSVYDHYDHQLFPVKNGERVKAQVYISFCNLIRRNNGITAACDEVPYVDVITNDETQVYEPAMNYDMLDDKQALQQFRGIFYLPRKLTDLGNGVFLYDWYYKNRIVVTNNERPIWVPVTNREYISRTMVYYTASLKEGKIPQMAIDALKKEIASIPAEMMDMPAYLNGNVDRPLTMICSRDEDASSPLYKINPAYFDPSLSRTAVQLITITIEGHDDNADYGGISSQRVWAFISGLKGKELQKLLDIK